MGSKKEGGKDMRLKIYVLLSMVLIMALVMACGGGGSSGTSSGGGTSAPSSSSGGGSSSNSLVGSWVLVSSNYAGVSQRLTFNAGGNGSWDSGSLTWTQQGNQAQVILTGISEVITVTLTGDTIFTAGSSGATATYKRA
jgi:hypothetical protein